jgi:hypothetical protein
MMFKQIASALWRAASSKTGKRVLTLGASWLVEKIAKKSRRTKRLIALTARHYGQLEAVAAKSGNKVDDAAIEAFKGAIVKQSDKDIVAKTVELLRAHDDEVQEILGNLPLKP